MANLKNVVKSITGDQTTAGGAEETLSLTENGTTSSVIPVAADTIRTISDLSVCGPTGVILRLQQSNDSGSSWFDIGLFNIPGAATPGVPTTLFSPNVGWEITGGSGVSFRVRVRTPGGSERVTVTIRSYVDTPAQV
jgi:hypothetical protein